VNRALYSFCIMVACLPMSAQVVQRLDLRRWGYKPPDNASSRFQSQLSSQIISVGSNGEIVVGFVTRDRAGLATRDLPPLSLRVAEFARNGEFLSQLTFPTPSWNENSLFHGREGALLIRTGQKLILLSPSKAQVAEKELPTTRDSVLIDWKIYPLPNRTAFLLYNYRKSDTSIVLLRSDNLMPIRECPYQPSDRVLAVSNDDILSFHSSLAETPLRRVVEVNEICGRSRFSYSWEGDATSAVLIDDDELLLVGGSSTVRLVVDGKIKWADGFDKKSDVLSDNVKTSSDGHFVAVAVRKFAGGSRFLDIPRNVKGVRIIVYEVSSGKKVLEVPVQLAPSSEFDFALSPTGDLLAIISDGVLEIVTVKEQH
jgi:hypothetical protein